MKPGTLFSPPSPSSLALRLRTLVPIVTLALAQTATQAQIADDAAPRIRKGPSRSLVGAALPGQSAPGSLQSVAPATSSANGTRPVILLTGYWPPTNEAVRRFSRDPLKNPDGWQGSDWMGSGYDVISYFPEFANPNCTNCGTGMGDLEVDYQDTTADFEIFTELHRPIAIITLSRGSVGTTWEVESNQFNRVNWIGDFVAPFQPDVSPPDPSIAPDAMRFTALPAQEIVDAVSAAALGVNPFICFSGTGGGFLSEYIAFLGVTYQAEHNDPLQPDWCVAAGHIHVGTNVTWPAASAAVDVTLGTVVDYVDRVLACPPMIPFCEGLANSEGFGGQLSAIGSPSVSEASLELVAQRVPSGTAGIAFYGPLQQNAPLGDGLLCVGGSLFRLPVPGVVENWTVMTLPLDFDSAPLASGVSAATPGSTWNFQVWYRDTGVGTGSNTTNGLQITFCP